GKRKEKKKSGFKTEKEALRSLLEVQASILNGNSYHVEHSQMTVSHLLDAWIETKKRSWKISTLVSSEHIVNTHIKPIIGHYKLKKLTSSIYESVFINKKLDDGFKPISVHRYHTLFKTAINFAVDEEILLRNRFTKPGL